MRLMYAEFFAGSLVGGYIEDYNHMEHTPPPPTHIDGTKTDRLSARNDNDIFVVFWVFSMRQSTTSETIGGQCMLLFRN